MSRRPSPSAAGSPSLASTSVALRPDPMAWGVDHQQPQHSHTQSSLSSLSSQGSAADGRVIAIQQISQPAPQQLPGPLSVFLCQSCGQPLNFPADLLNVDAKTVADLLDPFQARVEAAPPSTSALSLKRHGSQSRQGHFLSASGSSPTSTASAWSSSPSLDGSLPVPAADSEPEGSSAAPPAHLHSNRTHSHSHSHSHSQSHHPPHRSHLTVPQQAGTSSLLGLGVQSSLTLQASRLANASPSASPATPSYGGAGAVVRRTVPYKGQYGTATDFPLYQNIPEVPVESSFVLLSSSGSIPVVGSSKQQGVGEAPPSSAVAGRSVARSWLQTVVSTPDRSAVRIPTVSNAARSPSQHAMIEERERQQQVLLRRLRLLGLFFDRLSANSDIDHPLCQECADLMLESLDRQLEREIADKELYEQAMASGDLVLKVHAADSSLHWEQENQSLLEKEDRLRKILNEVEEEREAVRKELTQLDQESKELDQLEENYWKEYSAYHAMLLETEEEEQLLQLELEAAQHRLEKLKKTNVMNDLFHIWYDGAFGTINGLRLGRLPDRPVEWHEINAAWGYACLLLDILARRLSLTFDSYLLLPAGSYSRIERIGEDKATFELYGSGDIHLGRLFWNRRFDQAMSAYLNCMKQVEAACIRQDPSFKLHYPLDKDKVRDVSIKLQFNSDENWTKALKYMLTNLKCLLAHVCRHQTQQQTILLLQSHRSSVTATGDPGHQDGAVFA